MARNTFLALARFRLEQVLVRGFGYRLLLVALAIVVFSLVGGLLVRITETDFERYGDAVWWSLLRLTDPGYLGDDDGPWRRLISLVLTLLGYVVFLGALVAILTQWLNSTLERLEQGHSEVSLRNHVVVLGWTERTTELIDRLFAPGVDQSAWLSRVGARRMRVVLLVPHIREEHTHALRDVLGDRYAEDDVILRSGSPMHLDHLERTDPYNAAAIIMPSELSDMDQAARHDARVLRVLLTLRANRPEGVELPHFVAELSDPGKTTSLRRAYAGGLTPVVTDRVMGRLLAGCARVPGFAQQWLGGDETQLGLLSAEPASTAGRTSGLKTRTDRVPLAVIRDPDELPRLEFAAEDLEFEANDVIVSIASRTLRNRPEQPPRVDHEAPHILLLGWSSRAPDLVRELARHPRPPAGIISLSAVSVRDREADLAEFDPQLRSNTPMLEFVEGRTTSSRALARVRPERFDVVVVLASQTAETEEEADTTSILVQHTLLRILENADTTTRVLVELLNPDNQALLLDSASEGIPGGPFLSDLLARSVFEPTFPTLVESLMLSPEVELRFEPAPADIPLATFEQGVRREDGGIVVGFVRGSTAYLVPRDEGLFPLRAGEQLVVFAPAR